jgi:hypothetical protein
MVGSMVTVSLSVFVTPAAYWLMRRRGLQKL